MRKQSLSKDELVFSYLLVRRVIGLLGAILPFVLALGWILIFKESGIESSISAYYHTGMRDIFVGMLFAIGFFLLSYQGYDRQDNWAGNLAWLFAMGTAVFPTTAEGAESSAIGILHYVCAAALFATLVYFCLYLFTKTDPSRTPSDEKLKRNKIYRICGFTMIISLALIPVVNFTDIFAGFLEGCQPVFWLESIAIVAFGFSWLTKGEAIAQLNDREDQAKA